MAVSFIITGILRTYHKFKSRVTALFYSMYGHFCVTLSQRSCRGVDTGLWTRTLPWTSDYRSLHYLFHIRIIYYYVEWRIMRPRYWKLRKIFYAPLYTLFLSYLVNEVQRTQIGTHTDNHLSWMHIRTLLLQVPSTDLNIFTVKNYFTLCTAT